MNANYLVVIDACVLAQFGLCDLFLRLAETPRLYNPCWSKAILDEVQNTHQKFRRPWPKEISDKWRRELERAFPEAMVTNYEPIETLVGNTGLSRIRSSTPQSSPNQDSIGTDPKGALSLISAMVQLRSISA